MSTTLTVSNLTELYAALSQAQGGETILLEGGDYGALSLTSRSGFDVTFPDTVTITSADPANPAVFNWMDIHDAANLTLDGLTFDYTFAKGHPHFIEPFEVNNSTNITIRNSIFDGDLAQGVSEIEDGYGWGKGLSVKSSSHIVIENNEIFDFMRGFIMAGGTDLVVRGNDVHSVRIDAMNFIRVENILIEENYLHDFIRAPGAGDHADMIQFWTNGTTAPSTNVTIRSNVLMAAGGEATQSIFMRNEEVDRGRAGEEMFYRNILIEDNVIINGHVHGITVGETNGLVIRRNTLLRLQKFVTPATRQKKVTIPRINLKPESRRVRVEGNLALRFPAPRAGWVVQDNMVVQDISAMMPGYYHKVFKNAMLGDPRVLENFAYRPGGGADDPRLGAPLLQPGADRSRFAPMTDDKR
jgi:hypothetical protein